MKNGFSGGAVRIMDLLFAVYNTAFQKFLRR